MRHTIWIAIALLGILPTASIASTLYGSTITAAIYCCVAPTEPNRITNIVSSVVSDAVEFPENAFTFHDGPSPDGIDIDFGTSAVSFLAKSNSTAHPGTFNGFVFTFSGAPAILNVTINPISNFTPVNLAFTSNSITINFAGRSVTSASRALFDITLAPVPAPSAATTFAAGILALGLLLRRNVSTTLRHA